jgi:hypothetical protein
MNYSSLFNNSDKNMTTGTDFGADMLFNKQVMKNSSPAMSDSDSDSSDSTVSQRNIRAPAAQSQQPEYVSRPSLFSPAKKLSVDTLSNDDISTSSTTDISISSTKKKKVLSEEDILNMKQNILYEFDRLEKRGVKLPKRYTINSDLREMQTDLERIIRNTKVDASILWQRRMLLTAVSGLELMNNKFDPISAKLDGWSNSVSDGITQYDEIFEELYDKYGGIGGKMAPEMRLVLMVGGSAFMYHMTQSMFGSSTTPGLQDILRNNPELRNSFAQAAANEMKKTDQTGMAGVMGKVLADQSANKQMRGPQVDPEISALIAKSNKKDSDALSDISVSDGDDIDSIAEIIG